MFDIERDYCNAMIAALVEANRALLDLPVAEAVRKSHVRYKGDTLGLDQVPENTITAELTRYDQYAILITEERGEDANPLATTSPAGVYGARTFFGCDPCDRSTQFCEFLTQAGDEVRRVGDVLAQSNVITRWESTYQSPATITGANAAITCVRRGLPICAVLLNYITQELVVVCSAGMYLVQLHQFTRAAPTLHDLQAKETSISFPLRDREHDKRFVTFRGKPERGYPQNLVESRVVMESEIEPCLHHREPGGPPWILYLSACQIPDQAVGFIVANGEKIGEWIHWLPFVRFAHRQDDRGSKALRIFEVAQEQSLMRDGYLMMPSPAYSIFRDIDAGKVVIDVERLRRLDNPSKYRATFLVTPSTNRYAIGQAQQHGYRELEFFGD